MRSEQEIKELINLYILDVLDDDERSEAEEYLSNPEYLKYYKETKFILSETSFSIDDYELPENLKTELISKIDTIESEKLQDTPAVNNNVYSFPKIGYAIAASLLAVLFVYTFYLNSKLNNQELLIAQLKEENKHSHEFIEFINNPDVFSIQLTGNNNSEALGKLAWNKQSNDAMLYVENLEMPPKKDVYQVWVVKKDDTVSEAMGTFKVNDDGTYMLFIGCMPKPSATKAIFITMEPEGGMPEPTGMKYLSGYL